MKQQAIANARFLRNKVFLGFDPGGKRRFGVAWLCGSRFGIGVVDSAADALTWAKRRCPSAPLAAGIDTLLHWSLGHGGNRNAERFLRQHGISAGVISPNALRGAMVIGGLSLAFKLREKWPTIRLNETHPKALYWWLTGKRYRKDQINAACCSFEKWSRIKARCGTDDEFDALLSAWATREAMRKDWCNLVGTCDDQVHPIKSVTYWWPNEKRLS